MMTDPDLRAPFPWFGGKRDIAAIVWAALGEVPNYVEPFAGSLAVLLGRPAQVTGAARVETVNDIDRYLANFWRALAADPAGVTTYADWPVNEVDLRARHLWLLNEGRTLLERCDIDPDYYDIRVAGYWVWGLCAWIGKGWCTGEGPWHSDGERLTKDEITDDPVPGINRARPHLSGTGQGINRAMPHLGDYLDGLAARLRRVRVLSGDWQRTVGGGALNYGSTCGIFLDPPYDSALNERAVCYGPNDNDVSAEVREWCAANGDDPRLRIILCGYGTEHDTLGWRKQGWSTSGGNARPGTRGDENRHLEVLWFSPHCLDPSAQDTQLTF